MTGLACTALREYPYLDNWTDKADQFHEEGDERPLFGLVRLRCLRISGHTGEHQWPELVVPQPTRQLSARLICRKCGNPLSEHTTPLFAACQG